MPRRRFLALAATGVAGAMVSVPLSACGDSSPDDARPEAQSRERPAPAAGGTVLLAYFSRARENYWNGGRRNLRVGNTELLAGLIADRLDCDVHRIEAADAYPDDYDETVERNVREQDSDARPGVAKPLDSIDSYDTILLASPVWNVRAPMIMSRFADSYDFSGKTVLPVTTYAMSGLGSTTEDYAQVCRGARIGTGLAVRGEEVRSGGGPAVERSLRRVGLPS
jgi:flavodoxin